MLVVLAGFAIGSLWGYKGGVIVVEGNGFSNNLTQYDDFVPGSLTSAEDMEPFSFDVDSFDIEWLIERPPQGHGAEVRRQPDLPRDARRRGRRSTPSASTTRCPSAAPTCS